MTTLELLPDGGTVDEDDEHPEGILLSARLAAITLALVLATAIVASALTILSVPETAFTPQQRLVGTLVGFLVGWAWMSIALGLAIYAETDFYPPVPDLFAALGGGMMLVFNGIVVADPIVRLVVRAGGALVLVVVALYTARELVRRSRVDTSEQ